jgi:hypothetical protein
VTGFGAPSFIARTFTSVARWAETLCYDFDSLPEDRLIGGRGVAGD